MYTEPRIAHNWLIHRIGNRMVANLNEPLSLRSERFDHVLSFEVLEHLAEPDVMLREAFRILKPGGELTLSIPFQWWLHEAPWDYQRFTRYGLDYHLRKAGFEQIIITPTTGFWSMWLLKLNYQLKRLPRGPRIIRKLMTSCLIPIWWTNQVVAPWLDRVWPAEEETAGYFVVAHKP